MGALLHLFSLTAPLFLLVLIGYGLIRWARWDHAIGAALTRLVFAVAIPALLFRLMSGVSRLPPVDARLLLAYFGGALLVFFAARLAAAKLFRMDAAATAVFGVGGIFSNAVLLGLPLTQTLLGAAALPIVSLVLVFNTFLLWTLVSVAIEWARHGSATRAGLARAACGVFSNPVILSIIGGTAWGYTGWPLPAMIDRTLELVAQGAAPMSLIALGMGLAEFGIRNELARSSAIAFVKLAAHPAVVLVCALTLGLPPLETQVIVLLAGMPVGANVYLMARQFNTLGGPVAGSLVLSTLVCAATSPLLLAATTALIAR